MLRIYWQLALCTQHSVFAHTLGLAFLSRVTQMRPKHLRCIHINVNMIVDLRLAVHNNVVGFSLVKCDPLPSAERKVEKSGGSEVMLLFLIPIEI